VALYHEEVLADSPLLYLRFEEPSGATCANSGSLGGNATAQGTYTRNVAGGAAGLGVAITLNGATSDYVSYPHAASLSLTGDFTYECWVKSAYTAVRQCLMSKGIGSYSIHLETDRRLLVIASTVAVLHQASGAVPNDGNWHHVVVTRVGNTYTVYINGVATTDTSSQPIAATTSDFQIGRELTSGGSQRPLVGSIDEVAVYNTALSAGRIAAHYAARANLPSTEAAAAFSALASITTAGEADLGVSAAASFSALAGVSVAGAIRSPSILAPTGGHDTIPLMSPQRDPLSLAPSARDLSLLTPSERESR
jgi:hypothetical protein